MLAVELWSLRRIAGIKSIGRLRGNKKERGKLDRSFALRVNGRGRLIPIMKVLFVEIEILFAVSILRVLHPERLNRVQRLLRNGYLLLAGNHRACVVQLR